jgi:hypothetical protein
MTSLEAKNPSVNAGTAISSSSVNSRFSGQNGVSINTRGLRCGFSAI